MLPVMHRCNDCKVFIDATLKVTKLSLDCPAARLRASVALRCIIL